eukprot:PhF_6_TR44490/c0_g1_i2/m.68515
MNSDIRWAWGSVDGPLRESLREVVDLLDHNTMEVQTDISAATDMEVCAEPQLSPSPYSPPHRFPSNVNTTRSNSAGRTVACQVGFVTHSTSEAQVTEEDIAASQTPRDVYFVYDPMTPTQLGCAYPSMKHSAFYPTCNLESQEFPEYMTDAQALGVVNRYGYISLPRHAVDLPARRHEKFIRPVDYPHLYGQQSSFANSSSVGGTRSPSMSPGRMMLDTTEVGGSDRLKSLGSVDRAGDLWRTLISFSPTY